MLDNWPQYLYYQRLEEEADAIEASALCDIQKQDALEYIGEVQCCLRNILELN